MAASSQKAAKISLTGLPETIVGNIISRLDPWDRLQLSITCKKLENLVQQKSYWSDVQTLTLGTKGDFGRAVTLRLRAVLPKCGAYVKRVVFNSSVHSVQLSLIERYCPNLTSLEVRVGLVNDQLHLIGTKLGTRLKCLSLSRIFPDEEFVLERLLGRCSLLGELSIGPNDLQGGFIRGLFPCDQLKILSLHLCSGLSLVLAKFLMQMANRLVGLELINWDFRNCPDFFAPFKRLTVVKMPGMKADPVNGVLSSLPSVAATLSFLDLSRVNCLSDDSIDAISACEELKILNLEAAGEFHPASLTNLAKCSRLEYLNLSDTRHVDIHHLIELVSDLRSLKMLAVEGQNLAAHLAPAICTKAAWLETLAVWHVDEETLVAHMKRLVEAVGEEKVKLNHLYVANGDEISDETVDVMLKEFNCEIHQIFNWDELLPRNWLEIARIAVKKPVPQSVTDVDRDCRLENDKEDGEETKEELD